MMWSQMHIMMMDWFFRNNLYAKLGRIIPANNA